MSRASREGRDILGRRLASFIAVGVVCFVLGASTFAAAVAVLQVPDAAGVIHACYQKNNGQLRVVNAAADCNPSEVALDWNQRGTGGPAGPAGATGASGSVGAAGGPGATGASGTNGSQGATGVGATGATGSSGAIGATGPQGPTGDTGTIGATGAAGASGAAGGTGGAGATGPTGPIGATGATGAGGSGGSGASGATGTTGATGSTGSTGGGGPSACTWPTTSGSSFIIDRNAGSNRIIRVNNATGAECIAYGNGDQLHGITSRLGDPFVYFTELAVGTQTVRALDTATGTSLVVMGSIGVLVDPRALTFGPSDGMLYVIDENTTGSSGTPSFIQRIDPTTGANSRAYTFGSPLSNPRQIQVSSGGVYYVLDFVGVNGNILRIDVVSSSFSVLATFTNAVDFAYVSGVVDVLVGPPSPAVHVLDGTTGAPIGTAPIPTGYLVSPGAMTYSSATGFLIPDHAALGGAGALFHVPSSGSPVTVISTPVLFIDPAAIALH